MKVIIYKEEQILAIAELLRRITATGTDNFRMLSKIADLIESGQRGEYAEQEEDKNGMEPKKIPTD